MEHYLTDRDSQQFPGGSGQKRSSPLARGKATARIVQEALAKEHRMRSVYGCRMVLEGHEAEKNILLFLLARSVSGRKHDRQRQQLRRLNAVIIPRDQARLTAALARENGTISSTLQLSD
ncbi:MAG: hypothetical protein HYV77_02395 [Candidatus Wildermuthbacteria bacterium]|nr:hypothetical protein [Candidatus Wildermuthbacteria bacterium]